MVLYPWRQSPMQCCIDDPLNDTSPLYITKILFSAVTFTAWSGEFYFILFLLTPFSSARTAQLSGAWEKTWIDHEGDCIMTNWRMNGWMDEELDTSMMHLLNWSCQSPGAALHPLICMETWTPSVGEAFWLNMSRSYEVFLNINTERVIFHFN